MHHDEMRSAQLAKEVAQVGRDLEQTSNALENFSVPPERGFAAAQKRGKLLEQQEALSEEERHLRKELADESK